MDPTTITDWVAYIRDCVASPALHPELGAESWSVETGLSKISDDLARTPQAAAFADAALQILERGSPEEARSMVLVSLDAAPDAARRVARVLTRWRGTPLEDRANVLLRRGLEANADDPDLVRVADELAGRDPSDGVAVVLAALGLNTDLVVRHLDAFTPEQDPTGDRLRLVVARTPEADQGRVIGAIAAAGGSLRERFVTSLLAPDAPRHLLDELAPLLTAHHLY